ncbi:MAG: diguanylate cyclase [Pyrinomonadaceae bacterium]
MNFNSSNLNKNNSAQSRNGEALDPQQFSPQADKIELTKSAAEIWQEIQDTLAEESGLSILLVDGRQPPSLAVSNNNSVCRVLQSSPKHAHLCEPYCGKAFDNVRKEGVTISYRCHVNLHCVAVPLAPNPIRPLVAIVGRALARVSDYENLLDRKQTQEWQDLPAEELLKSLRFAESEVEIFKLAEQLQNLEESKAKSLLEFVSRTELNPFSGMTIHTEPTSAKFESKEPTTFKTLQKFVRQTSHNVMTEARLNPQTEVEIKLPIQILAYNEKVNPAPESVPNANGVSEISSETFEDFAAWQLFIDVLLDKSFKDACAETLRFLTARYGLTSLGWLERSQNLFKPFLIAENLRYTLADFSLTADDPSLLEAVLNETSLQLIIPPQIEIFPLAVGNDVRAAIIVGDEIRDEQRRLRLARFSHQIAVSLEVLRLREELSRRADIIRAVQIFSGKLNSAEENAAGDSSVNLFDTLLRTCAELLFATRGSLLLFDEDEQKLKVQAAFGTHADELKHLEPPIGERVAERIWTEGKPIVVESIMSISLPPAPSERGYRSDSFISFPLFVGSRAIGVLNLTDKRSAENADITGYNTSDLDLLEAIAPQLAIALDRANLQQKAGKFEQLSITDSLTGLLNRRYLDERVSEEVNRSKRDGTPMSILMIDIDNFKKYNDRFGHQAGDEVLKMTAQCLKVVLRGADVAARFGGEEFCLLLPNTTLGEARLIGERIRIRIEGTDFPHQGVTVSVGVSAYSPLHSSPQEVIEAADKALYQAKRIGKNNVQLLLFGKTRK